MKIAKITDMIKAIKAFFVKSNGILLLHHHNTPYEISEYYHEITNDLEMKHLSEDKKNMRSDGNKIRADIKRAKAVYESNLVNG
ncbi:hypothetical protein [Mucilaginibacter paludis]|uniref:Uncharacterized protein n=1 Tax=Mucilaginibacter paludis DSM 18603 TaxID=714943 RepID=H1YH63_9SPHI|nr:hypothetical protein [Mucilaginibacter paludis]EHQ24565.1 hypothetical protein Mucpa_0369 [Mucilaginibacter paludis DSM 18603]